MRIALAQVASPPGEPVAARRDRVGQLVAGAAGADLVVLPELWAPGYFAFDRYEQLAEPLDGDTVSAGREWARRLGGYLHLGSVLERGAGGALHNTAVLLDPAGQIAHVYRKIHVFGYRSLEAELLTPGAAVAVADTALGPVSATTCYDLRFPELWRALADLGAQTVIVPAAWPAARRDHWRLFTACRAVEEQVLLVACNAVGDQAGTRLGGHSRVVGPWGELLAEAGEQEGITCCEADPGMVARTRAEFPVLADRRPFRPDRAAVRHAGARPVSTQAGAGEPGATMGPAGRPAGQLRLRPLGGQPEFELTGPRLIVAGYTGRDADAVAEHIAELAAIGVPPPASVPCFFDLDPALLTAGPVVEAAGPATSGEVEPVLIRHAGRLYLGVGSDHTDRDLERRDIAAAKAACLKPLAAEVIAVPARLDELDWDAITIGSQVDGAEYQRGRLATLRAPADLLSRLAGALGPVDGDLVLFAGTVPLLGGQVIPGARWQITLTTAAGARLTHSYEVKRRSA